LRIVQNGWGLAVMALFLLATIGVRAQSPSVGSSSSPGQSAEGLSNSSMADRRFQLQPGEDPENRLISPFLKHLAQDQAEFWTTPARFRVKDLKWLAPFAGATAAFIASDSWFSRQVPSNSTDLNRSLRISDYSTYSLIGLGGAAYLFGHVTNNDHLQEAGLLSGEAAINSTAVAYLFKEVTQRQRPYQDDGNGSFFQGGASFPSEHSAIAWSIASVWAHEYPGWLSQTAAYGLASAVTLTRVTAKQHFPSDVIVGSALGWYFGRSVYRAHHDSELGGAPWGSLFEKKAEQGRNPADMGSSYVPMDSWVYPLFDRLIALGYIQNGFLGIRPWTRMECARLLDEAGETLANEDQPDEAAAIYRSLASEFGEESLRFDGAANVGAEVESVYSRTEDISGAPLRDGYHFAQTIENDYGRPFGEGANLIEGASARAEAGPFAVYVRGEYQQASSVSPFSPGQLQSISSADFLPDFGPGFFPGGFSIYTGSYSRFDLLEGYIAFNFHDLEFSFGKQSAWLGPSDSGPLLFSDNAEPIPMLKIDNTTGFHIGGLSRILGPARAEFFLGRLSGQQWIYSPPTLYGPNPVDQPFIHGEKISFKPTPNLEFGMGITAVFAGAGVPFTFREFFRTYYAHTSNLATNPGKRFSAFDFTYRIPGLRNWLTVYNDSLVVDEISPIGSTRPSLNPGIYMPRLPKLPHAELRAEGVKTSHPDLFSPGFVYFDDRYVGGYTNNGNLLGNWMGRAGWGGQGWFTYWFSPRNNLQFCYRAQRVDRQFLEGGSLNDFSVKWNQTVVSNQVGITALLQYENWRFPLLADDRKTDVTASLQLTYRPHWNLK